MSADAAEPMSRKLIALLAIGAHFGVSDGTAGLVVTVSQVFYGFGLVFLAPLGDLVDRRKPVAILPIISGAAPPPR